ncbi:sensor histidine kinase [Gracilimonas sp.]|uniref:sensor histidine kinase n=1 Tax=Gracilimonas sp. TaxID=1974203 RepID=UPI003D0D77CD
MSKKNILSFKTGIICLTAFAGLTTSVHAQTEQEIKPTLLQSEAPSLRFEHTGLSDGMNQASANTIMQDSKGFLWIATQGGLHRYDGYEFKVYKQTPFDTTSLSENWVWGMDESANGDIWVTTEGGGLNKLNQATGKFTKYVHDPNDSTSISSDRAFMPFEDSRGNLWVGTFGSGLNRMPPGQDGKFIRYEHDHDDPTTITSHAVYWMKEDSEGFLWAGGNNGISRINLDTYEITRFLFDIDGREFYGAPQNVLDQYLSPDIPGALWLATGNGLVFLDSKTGDFERYLIEPNDGENVNPLNFLHQVVPDPENPNVLWVAGPGTGVARFDIVDREFTSYRNNQRDPNSLSDNFATSMYADRSGTIWVGTATRGLSAFNPGAVNFTHLKNNPDDDQTISPGIVWGVFEDSEGTLWVGTDIGSAGDILTEFDINTGQVSHYTSNPDDTTSLIFGSIRVFHEDANGRFWIGTSGGLSLFDRTTKKSTYFRHPRIDGNQGRNSLFAIVPTATDEDVFWVGSIGGLDRFNSITGEYEHIPLPQEELKTDFGPPVLSLHIAEDSMLWAGTTLGLLQITPDGIATVASTYKPTDSTTINNNQIQSITQLKNDSGVLWLATSNGGLNRFDIQTGKATHFTEEQGLSNNSLYGLLVDNNNTLWMSSNKGISNFDPATETFRNYGLDDGLMALEYSQNGYFKGNNGVMYFGSGEGVTAFVPEQLHVNEIPPQVVLSDFKVFNKPVVPGPDSPLKDALSNTQKITLPYHQNEVTFDYVALHYANPKMNTYSYQLEGFDPDWIDAGNKRSATYTNLPEGEFTFKVKAANADGVWNHEGASIGLTILPPWYRTWWAYSLGLGMLGFMVFGVDRFQRSRISKKEQERQALREAELRAEAENKRRSDTEQLSQIGRAITSTLSVNKIIDTVYENVNALMDASIFGVGIYNEERNRLEFPATKEKGKMLSPFVNNLDEEDRLAVFCFKNKEEIIVGDYANEHTKYVKTYQAPIEGEESKSILYLPLVQQDRVIGVITTQSFKKDAYTAYHVNLLRNLATYAAIALDNASAYRKLNATLSELKDMQQQLIQQEKLASLGQLTAGIAHEIKNPLNFVNNFSDLNVELLEEARELAGDNTDLKDLLADIEANLNKIHEHGQRADSIVKSMLQHSRGGSGRKEPTQINTVVREYVNLTFHGMRAGKEPINSDIIFDLDESIDPIPLIAEDFSRVIVNLCNNAFDAMREKLKSKDQAPNSKEYKAKLTVRTSAESGNVLLQIEDNGPGIPDDMRDKIMQPFFTTKKGTEGTGLGLSITNDIIKAHGGTIQVDSEKGKGTIFTITLNK